MALKGLFGLCCGVENNLTFLFFGAPPDPPELAPIGFSSSESSTSWKSVGVSARFCVLNLLLKNDLKCERLDRFLDKTQHSRKKNYCLPRYMLWIT